MSEKIIDGVERQPTFEEVKRNTIFCICGKSIHDHPSNEDGTIIKFGWQCPFLPEGYFSPTKPLKDKEDMGFAVGATF